MRNVYEVLREKEEAIGRVRQQVEALRSAIPLLANEVDVKSAILPPATGREATTQTVSHEEDGLATLAPPLADEAEDALAKIRARLVEAVENDFNPGRSKKIARQLRHIAAPLLGANFR